MAFTQSLKYVWQKSGDTPIAREVVQVGSVAPALSVAVANGGTDVAISFAVDATTLQLFYLVSSQPLTVNTNSSTVPDDTWTLAAGIPLAWTVDDPDAPNPLSADITALYVTNASGAAATIECRALHN